MLYIIYQSSTLFDSLIYSSITIGIITTAKNVINSSGIMNQANYLHTALLIFEVQSKQQ